MARRPPSATKLTPAKPSLAGKDMRFQDPIFPADITSLCFDPSNMTPDTKEFVTQIKSWKRPNEWAKAPLLFGSEDDASPGDIEQGQLGDCWLLSALAVAASKHDLIKRLFVKADAARGEYRLRFYREGQWEEVTIDDLIPCGADGLPAFGHCADPNELWVPLVEKALAKLLGTYESLDGGFLEEGVVLLTGGRPERVTVNDWNREAGKQESLDELWVKLSNYDGEGHMMGAAICSGKELPDNNTGLIAGHAYAVLNVHQTADNRFRLVQLRNPWGSFEWKGKWSDGSAQWTKQYIQEVDEVNRDDGAFWMSLEDFRRYYDKITVCRMFNQRLLALPSVVPGMKAPAVGNHDWIHARFDCEWNDLNAGGFVTDFSYAQNPHINLSLRAKSRVFFLLSQPALTTQSDARNYRTAIGFTIHQGGASKKGLVKLPSAAAKGVFTQNPVRSRYNSCELHLEAGQYVVLPFTDFPNRKTRFVFEIYAESAFEAVALDEDREAVRSAPSSARHTPAMVLPDAAAMEVAAKARRPASRASVTFSDKPSSPSMQSNPFMTTTTAATYTSPSLSPLVIARSPSPSPSHTRPAARSPSPSPYSPAHTRAAPPSLSLSSPSRNSISKRIDDDRFMTTNKMFYAR